MRRLIRNTIFMGLFGLIARLSGLIRYVFLVTFLTDAQFGVLKLATDIGGVGRAFMDGGLDQLVSRDGARNPKRLPEFFWTAFTLKILLGVVFITCSPFILLRFMTPSQVAVALIYTCFAVALSLAGIVRSSFTALERMEYVFYTNVPSRLAGLVVVFLVLAAGAPLGVVAASMGLEHVIWLSLLVTFMVRFVPFGKPKTTFAEARWMVSESWPMGLYTFFITLYLRLDTLMLKWLLPEGSAIDNVGVYGKAQYPVEGINLLLTGYVIAVFPVFSRLRIQDRHAFAALFRRSTVFLLGVTLPLSVLMGGWADEWLSLFPNKSPGSVPILSILSVTLNFSLLNVFLITIFTACDRQRWLVVFTFLTVTVSFLSNFVMIPILGNSGAAFASLGSQIFLFTVMLLVLWGEEEIVSPVGSWIGLLVAANLAGLFSFWLVPHGLVLLVPFPFLLVYGVLVFVLRVVTLDDVRQFRCALRER